MKRRRPTRSLRRAGTIGWMAATLVPVLGCGSEPDDVPLWQPPPGAHSYDVTVTLTAEGPGADEIPQAFGLQIYASPSTEQLIIWDGSRAEQPGVMVEDELRLTVDRAFPLRLEVPRWTSTVRLSDLAMTIEARPDGLSGTLEGQAVVFQGDVGNGRVPVRGTLTGTLDREAPHLFSVDRQSRFHPFFSTVLLRANEPLAPDVALELHGDDGHVIPFETAPGTVFNTALTASRILRFGQRYRVVARTPIRDLAGNFSRQPLPIIETLPDPGWFDDPGFEGRPQALFQNCGVGPPGITGLRALWMWRGLSCFFYEACEPEAGSFFTARMRVEAGASTLRLSWRALQSGVNYDASSVILAAPGLGTSSTPFGKVDEPLMPIGGGLLGSSSHVLAVPLPAGAADEILVIIAPGSRTSEEPRSAVQIDDLRIE